jgi:UDP-N-acetylglucosamine:LPS N-acetylglucosamine transferase
VIENAELEEKLLKTVMEIINNPGKMNAMGQAMKSMETPTAAEEIARLLEILACGKSVSTGATI